MSDSVSTWMTFYGDDFTGSTDCLESLALAGVRAALFLEPPAPEELPGLASVQAVGVAGVSRALSPAQMDAELPAVFAGLARLGAPLVHYKVCSTFDSSPEVGSIGRALELGRRTFGSRTVPLLVGAPPLGRYCVFGNLFARSGGDSPVYRLDRHPTMSHHPVTPMSESDLRLHLGWQFDGSVALLDVQALDLAGDGPDRAFAQLLEDAPDALLMDVLTDAHLPVLGRLLERQAAQSPPQFVVGSSCVEYALTAHWREAGRLPPAGARPMFDAASQIVVMSGSCSPVTDRQIERALARGFAELELQPAHFLCPDASGPSSAALADVLEEIRALLATGRSVIVHTSRGPADPRIEALRQRMDAVGEDEATSSLLGRTLGRLLKDVIAATGLRRAVVTGGDTSGYVARELAIHSLEFLAPIAPGSPLCRIHARDRASAVHGMEITFKGGQVGKPDFFEQVLEGTRGA